MFNVLYLLACFGIHRGAHAVILEHGIVHAFTNGKLTHMVGASYLDKAAWILAD